MDTIILKATLYQTLVNVRYVLSNLIITAYL